MTAKHGAAQEVLSAIKVCEVIVSDPKQRPTARKRLDRAVKRGVSSSAVLEAGTQAVRSGMTSGRLNKLEFLRDA